MAGQQNRQAALITLEQVTVKTAFDKYKDQILASIDDRVIDAERFMRVALTVIRRTPKLEKCSLASILGSFVQCGQLGLYPDDLRGYVYLIPYYNTKYDAEGKQIGRVFEADLMVGYQGWVELFRQSGFAAMNAVEGRVVHDSDKFAYRYAMKDGRRADSYEHIPSGDQDPGADIRYYAILNYQDGTSAIEVMSRAQAEKHRDEYAKTKKKTGPWFHDMQFGEMAVKTCIRKITKYAPSSPNMRTAAALEERSEAGIDQRLDALVELNEKAMAPVIQMPAQQAGSTSKLSKFMDAAQEAGEVAPASGSPASNEEEKQEAKGVRDDRGNLIDPETGELLEEVDTGEKDPKAKTETKGKAKGKSSKAKTKPKPEPEAEEKPPKEKPAEEEPAEVEEGELSEDEAAKLDFGGEE